MTTQTTTKTVDESGFSAEWNAEGTELKYTAVGPDGKTVVETYTVKLARMSPAIVGHKPYCAAARHGIEQRTRDAGALPRGKNGAKAPVKDKMAGVRRVGDWLMSGTDSWNLPRAEGTGGGGMAGANMALLARALVKFGKAKDGKDRTTEQTMAVVQSWDAAVREQMLVAPVLKPHIDAVRAELAEAAGKAAGVTMDDVTKLLTTI